jgi:rubrerythrin
MSNLFRKLLLEESNFEDVDLTAEQESEEDTVETPDDEEVSEEEFEETTMWKVTFKLGEHTNWSRFESVTKDEATSEVEKFVTSKYPGREYELISVEEFEDVNEELNENLLENSRGNGKFSDKFYDYLDTIQDNYDNDAVVYLATQLIRYCKEDDLKDLWYDRFAQQDDMNESVTDAKPIEPGADVGMATLIADLIKDEYEAIEGYNSAMATAEAEGYEDMINVLSEIQAEENIHVGQLQTLMNMVDPNGHLVDDGRQEGEEQLANPIMTNESLKENVEIGRPDYSVDMSDEEYEEFRELLTKHYGSPADFFKRLHSYKPDFEIHNVDYDDIPEECVTLSSADISQGTGNVIVYTVMGKDTGKIYRYADF